MQNASPTLKIAIIGFTIIFSSVMLFTLINNETALSTNTYTYFFTILIPIIIAIWYINQYSISIINPIWVFVGICTIGFCYLVFYLYSQMNSSYYPVINYILNVIIFLGVLIALAILYNIVFNNATKIHGKMGLFIGLIFHIPCLISDFISYLLQQYKLTPNVVFVLFILELILVLLYIYLPKLLNTFFIPSGMVLQNEPIFLDTGITTLITSDKLNPVDKTAILNNALKPNPINQHYCISMWIYMNPQNKSNMSYTNEKEIFNYGYTDSIIHSKPRITYKYDPTTSVDTYYLYFTSNGQSLPPDQYRYSISVVGQKWNQFVFNYDNNIVDVFINGNLERTFHLENNLPQYSISNDKITVGDINGLDGAICNVTYSKIPLSKIQIANTYNLFMNKNPPINTKYK